MPAAAHVFVADLSAPSVDGADAHHLSRVLRLRAGETVTASDGAGGWRPCVFDGAGGLEPAGDIVVEPPPSPSIAIGVSPAKGDRTDWAVQKLTELGVEVIVLVAADRAVVRWEGDRAAKHVDRLRRIAREAAMQSRRVRLPDIQPPTPVSALVGSGAPKHSQVALAHPGGRPPSLAVPTVWCGPEGGWSDAELASASCLVDLGPTTLRAETAAVSAAALLCGIRSRLVGEA